MANHCLQSLLNDTLRTWSKEIIYCLCNISGYLKAQRKNLMQIYYAHVGILEPINPTSSVYFLLPCHKLDNAHSILLLWIELYVQSRTGEMSAGGSLQQILLKSAAHPNHSNTSLSYDCCLGVCNLLCLQGHQGWFTSRNWLGCNRSDLKCFICCILDGCVLLIRAQCNKWDTPT